jgi:ribosomal protein S18 acetylase RimI-like enzyme
VATLRRLTPGDIPQLHRLEAETYLPSLHESDEAFLKIIELFPEGAFGFFEGDELCAYAFAVPLPAGMVLELKTPLTELPPHADSLYIHDVAVGERHRGRGLATRLVATLLARARARGLPASELVSVQGSAPFWQRFGFQRIEELEYGPGAPATKMRYEFSRRPGS